MAKAKSKYSIPFAKAYLKKKGCYVQERPRIVFIPYDHELGNHSWGIVHFLVNHHGYDWRFGRP